MSADGVGLSSGLVRPDASASASPATLRPFYFAVVFWGETFRNYLADYCLPSLLAPGNIPTLGGGRHKFLFCTTPHDWEAISATDVFAALRKHIEPHFIEIPPAPAGKSGCEHMGVGHKLATQMAHRDRAYGVFLTPDMMVSDGTVASLRQHAQAGTRVVLVAALRFGEEPLFRRFAELGILGEGRRSSQQAQQTKQAERAEQGVALAITGRQMAAACIHSFHSETQRYEWEASYFTHFPAACWWRVPGEEGIVLHSLSWAPFLCDYSAVEEHDTSALENWTMDGDYIHQNFGVGSSVHVVTDSDEMMLVSWAPLADRPQSLVPNPLKMLPIVGPLIKGGVLRATLLSGVFDALKLKIFFMPVRWHAGEVTTAWQETEDRAARVLHRYAWDFDPSWRGHVHPLRRMFLLPWLVVARIWIVLAQLNQYRSRLAARLFSALCGDREAWGRIRRRAGIMLRQIIGAEVKTP
jgi:hypothetical protein